MGAAQLRKRHGEITTCSESVAARAAIFGRIPATGVSTLDKIARDRHLGHCSCQVRINSVDHCLAVGARIPISGEVQRRIARLVNTVDPAARQSDNLAPLVRERMIYRGFGSALIRRSKWPCQSSILGDRKISYTL
jgi:hypothetical protein